MPRETVRLVEQHIDALPSPLRTVFVMRAIEEYSVRETAACLGISEAKVRTRYFRACQLLRKSLHTEVSTALRDAFAFDGERCDQTVRQVLQRLQI